MMWPPKFLAPKDPALRIQITYGWGRAAITCQGEPGLVEHNLLVVAYLLFTSTYFYSCKKSQIAPIRQLLADYAQESGPPEQLAPAIVEAVKASLYRFQKAAFDGQ